MRKMFLVLVMGLAVLLSVPLGAQKKIEWLTVDTDKFTGKITVSGNLRLLVRGVKEGTVKWKGVSPFDRPVFNFLVECEGKDCQNPTYSLIFVSRSEGWGYLNCHEVHCLADSEVVKLPESVHHGDTSGDGVTEMVVVPSDRPTFEKLWEAKVLEFKICNTELALSPIEKRMLQELKALLESFEGE